MCHLLLLLMPTFMTPMSTLSLLGNLFLPATVMDLIRASSNATAEYDRMVKIELEAAEALAGLAHFLSDKSVSKATESVAEVVKDESNNCNSSFDTFPKCSSNCYEATTNFKVKDSEKSGGSTAKSGKDEQSTQLRLAPSYPPNHASSRKKSRQNLTQAEMEARKIRRVLANRESARQTIRRRQAFFEELTRKAVDLAWENEILKRKKDMASKRYDSLKTKNGCLKAQMTKMVNNEAEETREESISINDPTVSTSSTSSFVIYNQPSFLPFVWPSSVHLQCGSPAGIVFPSHSAATADSSSCEGSYMTINTSGAPLCLLPCPWLVTVPQNSSENYHHSFNLNNQPKESSECQQFFPEKSTDTPANKGFPPDGGGRQTTDPVRCKELLTQHDDSGIRSCDMSAATEARKRRKQLTRIKNNFHCRQLPMH